MQALDPEVRGYVEWFVGSRAGAVLKGIGGALVVAAPLLIWNLFVRIAARGALVAIG